MTCRFLAFLLNILLVLSVSNGLGADRVNGPKCPAGGIGSKQGDRPSLTIDAENGLRIIVCGGTPSKGTPTSEFNVYSVDPTGRISGSIYEAGARDSRLLTKQGKTLAIDEVYLPDVADARPTPLFRSTISCSAKGCNKSEPICVFKRLHVQDTAKLKEFREYVTGRKKGEVPDDMLVIGLGELALSGNKDAQTIFQSRPGDLALDGASSEQFDLYQGLIGELDRHHCL